MNKFELALSDKLGSFNFTKIQSIKVGIAGAGGLGSNCAFNLVRSGFKRFKIIDFDYIDYSNLNRQFYFYDQVGMHKVVALKQNLLRINPDIYGEFIAEHIEAETISEIFGDCDVVVEAFDKPEYKRLFVERLMGTGKFLVCVSGLAGWGDSDSIIVRRVKNNIVMIGDLVSDFKHAVPISPKVNVAAAKQADVILEYVLREPLKSL